MRATAERRVLIVEDDSAVRGLIAGTLQRSGFCALEAGSGREALSVLGTSDRAVDLAIVDMVMPGMSGLDLAAELDRQRPGFKILYISGCVDSIALEGIATRWPELVLLKPFSRRALVERVQRLLT